MKRLILHFLIISVGLFFGQFSDVYGQETKSAQVRTVVIDPGHGGKDPGAVSGGVKEKDVVLKVALKLGDMIKKAHPDVNVIYTRKTDVYLELYKRSDIANNSKADLFISIHANAASNTSAVGTETFVMGEGGANENLDVAKRENSVILLEDDYETRYQGYQPDSPESFILFSLMQYVYQEQSILFADQLQKQFTKYTSMPNRGAKNNKNLLVLRATSMPSVLTEIGFISNANERKFMNSDAGQTKLAQAMCDAFTGYKSRMEKNGSGSQTAITRPIEPIKEHAQSNISDGAVKYRIQVAASSRQMNTSNSSQFGNYRNKVTEIKADGLYKYYVEETDSYKNALELQKKVRQKFKDAFIVAFQDGERIVITDEMKKK